MNLKSQTSVDLKEGVSLTLANPKGLCRNGNRTIFEGEKKSIYKELSEKANLHTPGRQVLQNSETVSLANLVGNKCLMMNYLGPIKIPPLLIGDRILKWP